MGTNYYWVPQPDCECCGRPFEPIHIGKSSYGWCFSLHVDSYEDINTLNDWQLRWSKPGSFIRNEYGDTIPIDEMLKIITERSHGTKKDWNIDWWSGPCQHYTSEQHFHDSNCSERGPNFLLRHRVDGRHCLGHGPGTYDYIAGEFS
jgi:hypothetical protein